jgi:hypothetical protein
MLLPTRTQHRSPRPATRSGRRVLIACLVLLLLVPAVSYLRALLYPGQASTSVRSVEWLRDNGGSGAIDALENWWYTRHAPSATAPDPTSLPAVPAPAATRAGPAAAGLPAPLPVLAGVPAAPGEGRWAAGRAAADGVPAMVTTFVRPDPAHPGVVAGVARFDQRRVRGRLIAGTREPDGQPWPEGGQVPPELRAGLVAAFNSGFKMAAAQGGFYAGGRYARPLRDGAASLVIDRDGHMSVGAWGRDARFGPEVAAVRQNLALIVDNGVADPGLGSNAGGRWGSARNQLQYTWRSAIGTDPAGNLVYVGGNQLNLTALAHALTLAGVSRGMELDIHPRMVDLLGYHPAADGEPVPNPLLPTMPGPATRYLYPDQRDFVAVALR